MRYLFAYIVTLLAVISLTLCENLVLGNHEWSLASIESGDVGRHGDEHGVIFFNFTTPNKKHYLAFHILWNPSVRPPSLKWTKSYASNWQGELFARVINFKGFDNFEVEVIKSQDSDEVYTFSTAGYFTRVEKTAHNSYIHVCDSEPFPELVKYSRTLSQYTEEANDGNADVQNLPSEESAAAAANDEDNENYYQNLIERLYGLDSED